MLDRWDRVGVYSVDPSLRWDDYLGEGSDGLTAFPCSRQTLVIPAKAGIQGVPARFGATDWSVDPCLRRDDYGRRGGWVIAET
jgi:hypothetical protein